MKQDRLMRWDPANQGGSPYPSHAAQYRLFHGQVAWLFNPWTGNRRDARDIGTDTFGHLISDGSAEIAARIAESSAPAHGDKP